VRLCDAELEDASLFPFFDDQGAADALMLVWPESRTIAVLELRSGLVEVPMWGAAALDVDFAALRDLDARGAARLAAGRWHYDPWWVLREPRFRGHPAVPALKATNCAGRLRKPFRQLYFEHDLSSIYRLTVDYQGFLAFSPDLLPARPDPYPESSPAATGWRLDPVWRHPDWWQRLNA
jgi:hypothetical protein